MKDYIQRKVAEFKEIQKESFMTATAKPLLLQPEAVAWYEQDLIETIKHAEQEMMKKVVEIVNFIDYDFLADLSNEEKYPVEYSINFERKRIRTALSSLDKPLTDKE